MPTAIPLDDDPSFDIVSTYDRLLSSDPDLTMPIAAIESLILSLAAYPCTTVSETLDRIEKLAEQLKSSIPNAISLTAGTDVFKQYLVAILNRPNYNVDPPSIADVQKHLIENGKLFVERAKAARQKIAAYGRMFIKEGDTVLTIGGSRVVGSFLKAAAVTPKSPTPTRFRVIYVLNDPATSSESADNISALRAMGIPVAAIPPTAIAYAMAQVTSIFVGAEGVVENGGIISRLGTYQMGMLAKAAKGTPFYVLSETHKFVRLYPLGQKNLGVVQNVVDFRTTDAGADEEERGEKKPESLKLEDSVDYTPPNLITAIVTENGVMNPSAVSEDLIRTYW